MAATEKGLGNMQLGLGNIREIWRKRKHEGWKGKKRRNKSLRRMIKGGENAVESESVGNR